MSLIIQRKKDALESPDIFSQKNVVVDPKLKRTRSQDPVSSSSFLSPSAEKRPEAAEPEHECEPPDMCEAEGIPAAGKIGEGTGANQACASCVVLRNKKRKLSNTVKSLRKKIIEKRKEFAKIEKKLEGKFFFRSGLCYYFMKNVCSHRVIIIRGKYGKWRLYMLLQCSCKLGALAVIL